MKKLWLFLVIGILIRVILAFSTFHPDIQAFNLAGKIFASGNILNLYDYLPSFSEGDPLKNLAVFNYPPAIYLFSGIFNFLFSNIFMLPFINVFLLNNPANYGNILFNFHLLFLKLPYLLFDLSIAFMLFKLMKSERESKLVFILWMFNPVNLYSTYMIGQFDIIPTFFTVLSVYLIAKQKFILAALALGGGIAFKIYPIFLIIPLLILGRNWWERFKLLAISLTPYFLSILPYLISQNFRTTALFANQNSKSLYANIPISGGESIFLFPFLLILFYMFIWQNKQREFSLNLYLIPLLLFFMFTHFHPQWLIWITPFIIVMLVEQNFKNLAPILLMLVSYILSLFFFDPSLTVGLFAPLIPALNGSLSIWEQLGLTMDYNLVRSLLQTVFAAASFYLVYKNFPKKANE